MLEILGIAALIFLILYIIELKKNGTLKERLKEYEVKENLTNEYAKEVFKNSVDEILEGFEKDLKDFKEKIERFSEKEIENFATLKNELSNLKELNSKLQEEANNLAKALNSDVKKQGTWGEMVLDKILELSGLKENRDYLKQPTFNIENRRLIPDVVINLPNNRFVVVDSKVSLKAYKEYVATLEEKFLNEHIASVKKHIDLLSSKEYEKIFPTSPDFVLMFMPIEGAVSVLDEDVITYAFKKKVVITTPSTLLIALRSIENSLRFNKEIEEIKEVVNISEKLYDKFYLFFRSYEKGENYIQKAIKEFDKLDNYQKSIINYLDLLKEKAKFLPKRELK